VRTADDDNGDEDVNDGLLWSKSSASSSDEGRNKYNLKEEFFITSLYIEQSNEMNFP